MKESKELTRTELESIHLKDDETPYGGTALIDETVDEFCDSIYDMLPSSWSKNNRIALSALNKALKECGIKPIIVHPQSED